jgi:hypothetical protein
MQKRREKEDPMPRKWKPKSDVAKIVHAAGFDYDPDQDIIYSRMYPWQRNFGYAYSYDLAAPVTISAVIDCEPFFFHYKGKDWMIELWKGQYGLETGGEVGVYICRQPYLNPILGIRPHDPENGKFFDCVSNAQRLNMSFTLRRNGEPLFRRGPERHWWLTGFKWGVLSKPDELTMHLEITFPDTEMQAAFLEAVKKTGYTDVETDSTTVRFVFDKPKTYQSHADPKNTHLIEQVLENDTKIVGAYSAFELQSNDPNQIPSEAAAEIVDYFTKHDPLSFIKLVAEQQEAQGQSAEQTTDALEKVHKRSRALIRRIGVALSRFFRRLFA